MMNRNNGRLMSVSPLGVLAVVSYLGHSKKFLIDWLIDGLMSEFVVGVRGYLIVKCLMSVVF